jgi:hypothetical protein
MVWSCFLTLNPGGSAEATMSRQQSALRDVNGDGAPDMLFSEADGGLTVALSRVGRTSLLEAVSRPLGATVALAYERSGNTPDQPQSRWVLAKVEVDDGHPGDGVDVLVTTYAARTSCRRPSAMTTTPGGSRRGPGAGGASRPPWSAGTWPSRSAWHTGRSRWSPG